ncbi:RICIN domain-containing protein [Streptomyces mexicanus]|uniref:RICIN domain-containing protein n=2 Tax=Streptomyces mexicanus TaxID=178566 RepID=A0A7X1I637_9ACTN|nr:RICIN domain-containing protein [Streptomyces mexicanus]
MTALAAGSATAAPPLSGTKIRSWQSGHVLAVTDTVGGSQVQYQTDTDALSQKWAVEPVSSSTFLLRNLSSDMCVTAIGGGDTEALQQRPCDPRWDEQLFSLEASGKPSRYLLKNQGHNKCLQQYNSTAPTYARLYACSPASTWQIHSFDVR